MNWSKRLQSINIWYKCLLMPNASTHLVDKFCIYFKGLSIKLWKKSTEFFKKFKNTSKTKRDSQRWSKLLTRWAWISYIIFKTSLKIYDISYTGTTKHVCKIFQSIRVGQTSQKNTKSFYSTYYSMVSAHNLIWNSQSLFEYCKTFFKKIKYSFTLAVGKIF